MTSLVTIFASSFVIALSGALMPGPLLTATVTESSQRGFIAGPLLVAGHAVLEGVVVIAILMGLAPLLQQTAIFSMIAFVGSALLVWMAFGMFRSLPSLTISLEKKPDSGSHPVVSGILMSAANPYWVIWWATIGLGYVLYAGQFGRWGIVLFFTGHILADLVWYSLVAAAVAGGRRFLTDRLYRGLIAVCATFLVAFAVYFAWAGSEKISTIAK